MRTLLILGMVAALGVFLALNAMQLVALVVKGPALRPAPQAINTAPLFLAIALLVLVVIW